VWTALQENSWVMPDKKSKELLRHEQGHFDFGRLLALEFEKQADSTLLRINNCGHKLDSIFNSIFNNIKQMNAQYDKDTNHMLNRKEQKRRNKKIADMLKAAE
jgi:predicted secreted Zn-dependent protease